MNDGNIHRQAGKDTHNMRLDAQTIKLLLVINPGFGRIIGDEEDAFPCNKGEGSDRNAGQPNAGEGEGSEDDEYDTSGGTSRALFTYYGCVESRGLGQRRL